MTDYTKLIERMRDDAIFDNTTLGNEAADAIEALQKEVSALDVLLEECKMDWSGDVTQLKAEHKHEIEELQSDRDQLQRDFTYMKQQRDTWKRMFAELQSKLDAMCKGEPVGFVAPHELKDLSEGFPAAILSLLDRLKKAEKDAGRYRWLRSPDTDVSLVIDKRTGWVPPDEHVEGVGGYHTYEYRAGEELDAALDSAMEASK